ncbi:MAG: import inner rane translocase subunit Tim44 [Solirubrobacterales bacterium]|nr:import inner rane translocase subunit Tim44 [Solirubrobacterales bacterium]
MSSLFLAAAGGGSSGFGGGGGGGGGGGFGGGGGGYAGGGGSLSGGAILVIIVLFLVFFAGATLLGLISTQRYNRKVAERVKRVRTASAEAAEDDAYFAYEAVEAEAADLFKAVQTAWDARDSQALSQLAGPDLLVEWRRRLHDFDMKGWHNQVRIRTGPQVQYVGMVNREDDLEDRVVIRIHAEMNDWCTTKRGEDIFHDGATSAQTSLREYWTLARSSVEEDAHWILMSIEQQAEGDHHLDSDIVASPWGDDKRIGAAATLEVAAADTPTEGFTTADLVDPDFAEDVRAAALDLSLADARFGPDVILASVSRAVEAWVEAVDGPDAALAALATPEAIRALLHPGDEAPDPHTRLVVRGVRVERIDVQALEPSPEPARITVAITARGRRYIEDRDTVQLISGDKDDEREFVEYWVLALTGDETAPWRIVGSAGVRQ